MSKAALLDAIKAFDLASLQRTLAAKPELEHLRLDHGFDLLQFCCSRPTAGDRAAADRQLRMARWFVAQGFDATAVHVTAPGEDGEAQVARVSLAWFAVARAQNNRLARYFLQLGAQPNAFFAAVWWANHEILADLVAHGGNINEVVGATALHMAVDILERGTDANPALARRRRKTLETMLRLGADPNLAAHDGTTPLRTALDKGYAVAVFELLLTHGANPDVAGKDGRTVREVALRKRDKRYANALAPPPAS
jgi:hypothetical protein